MNHSGYIHYGEDRVEGSDNETHSKSDSDPEDMEFDKQEEFRDKYLGEDDEPYEVFHNRNL